MRTVLRRRYYWSYGLLSGYTACPGLSGYAACPGAMGVG